MKYLWSPAAEVWTFPKSGYRLAVKYDGRVYQASGADADKLRDKIQDKIRREKV